MWSRRVGDLRRYPIRWPEWLKELSHAGDEVVFQDYTSNQIALASLSLCVKKVQKFVKSIFVPFLQPDVFGFSLLRLHPLCLCCIFFHDFTSLILHINYIQFLTFVAIHVCIAVNMRVYACTIRWYDSLYTCLHIFHQQGSNMYAMKCQLSQLAPIRHFL